MPAPQSLNGERLAKALEGLKFSLKWPPIVPTVNKKGSAKIECQSVTSSADGLYRFARAVRQTKRSQSVLTRWGKGKVVAGRHSLRFESTTPGEAVTLSFAVAADMAGDWMPEDLHTTLAFIAPDQGFAARQMAIFKNLGRCSEQYLSHIAVKASASFIAQLVKVPDSRRQLWREMEALLGDSSGSDNTNVIRKLFPNERKEERRWSVKCLSAERMNCGSIKVYCGPPYANAHRTDFEVDIGEPHMYVNCVGLKAGIRYSPGLVDPMISAATLWPNLFPLKVR